MKPISLYISILILLNCYGSGFGQSKETVQFSKELKELQTYFHIPGIAVLVEKDGETVYEDYLGYANIENKTKVDSTTLFPIASLTKIFSGVLVFKLVEEGRLSLNDPVNNYLNKRSFNDSIQIKHILSHTSQGKIGKNFYYSYRFGALTPVIEKASGQSFQEFMSSQIFNPLGLKNTSLLKDSLQIAQHKLEIATPYIFDGNIKPGFIDFGYSTSAGIVSNLKDLLIFSNALDNNLLISEASKKTMFSTPNKHLPYGHGIFSQEFDGRKILWGYGQYDCYSSLLLKIPEENLTLILLANNNLISDPARLIYGDIGTSLFALSFLKNYSYGLTQIPLLEETETLYKSDFIDSFFIRKKFMAQALSESFLSRFDTVHINSSARFLEKVFEKFPDYLQYSDLNLLHNLSFLKDVSFYKEMGDFTMFDDKIIAISNKLLTQDKNNPYANMYLATFYDRKGNISKARYHFEAIANAKNFSPFWYTAEANTWLKEHK
ncbi:beta-lactamase family protein [Flagellimonas sp. HMM57]|uniref:serine hydrolase domain-containing protein n=1 Tax=unclassified Flagellimonas TaxID=2644544 RepID=UPI0013D7A17D|nr:MULTISPECIES: serine hydrolase domain-containing protein [unclassified Flagellimonas]UII76824.1 beta-lactamase family protein [Flagellimonas sp. HMM57]